MRSSSSSATPRLVRKVCSDADVADAIVGFHAQQAAEKLIKAVLAARGVTFVKSHALSYLIGLVEDNDIEAPDEISEADVLSPWTKDRLDAWKPFDAATLVKQLWLKLLGSAT
jgi:hypothetical protein